LEFFRVAVVVGWERRCHTIFHYIETWLQSHRCDSDTQMRTASQMSTVKQEHPVWKFLQANTHFIRIIWCSLPFHLAWERHSHTSLCSTTLLGFFQLHMLSVISCLRSLPTEPSPEDLK